MQPITRSDFENWSADPVTKAFKLAIAETIGQIKDALAAQAGLDSNEDNFKRGYITAMSDTLQFRIEDLQEAGE